MSRGGKRAGRRAPTPAPESPRAPARTEPTGARRALLLGITVLIPALLLLAVEGIARLIRPDGIPLFRELPAGVPGRFLAANPVVASRWFTSEGFPPAPLVEHFAAVKPARAFRVFVLGESSAAGFPYPRNVTFSRVIRDALRDVLPGDSVEVVNLGIPAINSYALLDMAAEVRAQRPDAVIVYAGHNEYYGVLGVGSAQSVGSSPAVVRAYLRLLRARSVLLLRDAIARARREGPAPAADQAVSFMELLARDQQIALDGAAYRAGIRQYEGNLARLVRALREDGIPVLVGSPASNLRDQRPFAAAANGGRGGADSAFAAAHAALAAGDTARARAEFVRARDLDVVRFRAPTALERVTREVAARDGGIYVPVAEAFASASPGGIPGRELFLEHVHPTADGHVLIARAFVEALRPVLEARGATLARLRPWPEYRRRMELTPFDERIAEHTVNTLLGRWPFVPAARQTDYRGTYRAASVPDSLALLASRGMRWERTKVQLAQYYEQRGHPDSAAAEYRGLARDAPLFDEPLRLLARALLASGQRDAADSALKRAMSIRPSARTALAIGIIAMQRRDAEESARWLERAAALDPRNPALLHQLALAHALAGDRRAANVVAARLARIQPDYPGLRELLQATGAP